MSYDILIRGGTVYDGSGKAPVAVDIAIADGNIAEIGRISGSAKQVIDASGLAVAPGFIDIHSHSDYTLLIDPRAMSAVAQGRDARGDRKLRLRLRPDRRYSARRQRDLWLRQFDSADLAGHRRLSRKAGSRAACDQCDDADAERAASPRDAWPVRARRQSARNRAHVRSPARGSVRRRRRLLDRSRISQRSRVIRRGTDGACARGRAGRQVLRDAHARPAGSCGAGSRGGHSHRAQCRGSASGQSPDPAVRSQGKHALRRGC